MQNNWPKIGYIKPGPQTVPLLQAEGRCGFYNHRRPHPALGMPPAEAYSLAAWPVQKVLGHYKSALREHTAAAILCLKGPSMKYLVNRAKVAMTQALLSKFSSKYKLNHGGRGFINFIDVGSVGSLPDPWRQNAHLVSFLLNFEPNESPKVGPSFMTYNTAVWEAEEIRPFYVYKGFNATGSSLFKQNFDYVRSNYDSLRTRGPKTLAETWLDRSQLAKTVELECRTVDSVLRNEFPSRPFHFMKVDAQGAEYNILKGSESFLSSSCAGLHLELFTLPLYEGIVLLEPVVEYLSRFGFRMVKKFPAHGTFDSQHDCIFLRDRADPVMLSAIRKLYALNESA